MYKIILWDLDDTLWNFRVNGKIALEEVFKEFELIKYFDSFESFYNIYEKKNKELWELYAQEKITKDYLRLERFLYPLRVAGHEDQNMALNMGPEFLRRTTNKKNLVEGAIEILEYCKKKYKMSVISNGFREVQYKKLEHSGLLPYFDNVFLSDEVGYQKPDNRFFDKVISKLNVDKKDCIVIGDNLTTDIEGALKSGLDAIFFDRDNQFVEEQQSPFIHIKNLYEVKKVL